MAILRPTTEISNIGWTLNGGANYATILSDQLDGTYVSQNSAAGADLTVALASGTDPLVDTGFTIYARARRTGTDAELNLNLRQGGTLIKTGLVTIGASFSNLSVALSSGEASAITDFTALRIQLDGGGGDIGGQTYIADVWLELPDLSTGGFTYNAEIMGSIDMIMCDQPLPPGVTTTDREFQFTGGQKQAGTFVNWWCRPKSPEDARGAKVCAISGYMFPASQIVWVNDGLGGGWYGAPFAPDER